MIDRKVEGGVDKDGWQYGRKINRYVIHSSDCMYDVG